MDESAFVAGKREVLFAVLLMRGKVAWNGCSGRALPPCSTRCSDWGAGRRPYSQGEREFYVGFRCKPAAGGANVVANDPEPTCAPFLTLAAPGH
jgi:hypothetical protein